MADIYYMYPPKLPGHKLLVGPCYTAWEGSFDINCSIVRRDEGAYNFYYVEYCYDGIHSGKLVRDLKIESVSIANGQELLCWLYVNSGIDFSHFKKKLYSALNNFDPNFADEFNNGNINCDMCFKKCDTE